MVEWQPGNWMEGEIKDYGITIMKIFVMPTWQSYGV